MTSGGWAGGLGPLPTDTAAPSLFDWCFSWTAREAAAPRLDGSYLGGRHRAAGEATGISTLTADTPTDRRRWRRGAATTTNSNSRARRNNSCNTFVTFLNTFKSSYSQWNIIAK